MANQVVDGKYVVTETVSVKTYYDLAAIQQQIDGQQQRMDKANLELQEATTLKEKYEALKTEMIEAGIE